MAWERGRHWEMLSCDFARAICTGSAKVRTQKKSACNQRSHSPEPLPPCLRLRQHSVSEPRHARCCRTPAERTARVLVENLSRAAPMQPPLTLKLALRWVLEIPPPGPQLSALSRE